ncbi:MAG: nucleoside deaminase [Alphaproteobacteria bacterium]|nr:MAG: nucleoside deaminase [Alphaproteobacteria bacterium]
MVRALTLAKEAAACGEVPVGAVIVCEGVIIAEARNAVEQQKNVCAHAEMLALQRASSQLGEKFLLKAHMYVTLEPCAMCAAAISYARIARLYFGAYDPKSGGVEHGARVYDHQTCHSKPEIVGGICEREATTMLSDFFQKLR